ncbi:FecR family protein [Chitinophaga horti]|uniref:FecR family protein n=1 Tax=Chitinophaga horti TaxID=2920382 RepID=A0ABY6IVS1_9BACT|nr:FecR family protein [Chitinophaga horti]UYQ91470.1 FecR family protein [Chitinophaga horti]
MKDRLDYLFQRYLAQACSAEEQEELSRLLNDAGNEERFRVLIEAEMDGAGETLPDDEADEIFHNITGHEAQEVTATSASHGRKWWMAAAALLVLVAGLSGILLQRHKPTTITALQIQDAPAGKNGALLTLANGEVIVLDSAGNGQLAVQGNSKVLMQNGQLAYQSQSGKASTNVLYNTLRTPRGRKFSIVLPDGTTVWLNAASSLRYPAVFNGNVRKVEITGEVYFDVATVYNAQHHKIPFEVQVNDHTKIEVLGTQFNVNAYTEEQQMKTTLLEGAVRLNNTVTLRPGQQACVAAGNIRVLNDVNTAQAVAWKNNIFYFGGRTRVDEVLRQLSRWYDVDIVYEKGVPDLVFTGKMQRSLSLSQALKGLGEMGLHFKIEEKKLYVNP